ncbi:hypothetical protein KR52_11450 [Synechococcus sp. KORDI-52]|uniref:sodium:solute symporter family protein n=1 Tax=Synechococcus sp. KORDI-52 TaxID=585425 RepID=UPI0004E0A32B|nr:sodium:solute symporter family protein [Synechococcus sp. KORDI-52]AII49750.1 hypothetical protein KR52_11450 [Synechococcus sp. KORDI-52]
MNITLATSVIALSLYLGTLIWLGTRDGIQKEANADTYFLADRRLQAGVLFFTLIATNFSAFFFLGFAGAGYRIGMAYYPMMALGTGLAALTIGSFGCKVRQISKDHQLITPSELVGHLLPGEGLRLLVFLLMLIFTLPYLALQPIGAGYLLESMTGGTVPFGAGAVLLTLVIVLYVITGGMKAVAWTDVLQGILMFVLMILAFVTIAQSLGGVEQINRLVMTQKPELFSGAGVDTFFSLPTFASYLLLWPLCLPMFPQLMMRFFAAGDDRSLKQSMVLYPVVAGVLFIFPVLIGVWGHISFPDLDGRATDQVLPMMLSQHSPEWVVGLVMVGALAAFMSTLDSQLLALSSMVTRDIYCRYWRPKASLIEQVRVGKVAVCALAVGGLAIAMHPPEAILALATNAFSGLAVLFPMMVGATYGMRWSNSGAILSVLGGETMLLGLHMGWIPAGVSGECLPVVPAVIVTSGVLLLDHLASRKQLDRSHQ